MKKAYIWPIVGVVAVITIILTYQWYVTRISPDTPQAATYDCPTDKPIKGNSQTGIYHIPGDPYYKRTKPERCFATEQKAQDAGFRKSTN